ncbi:CG6294, partial [Drosophila busckii]
MSSGIKGCKRVHQIEVEQLADAAEVQHSLLLIKGRLQPNCASAKQLKATLTLRETEQEQLTQLSSGSEFKLLFDLAADEDIAAERCRLQLRCCSGELTLCFSYQPRRSAYRVQPLYIVCQQEQQTELETEQQQQLERCALIDLNLRLVQCIYAHKLAAAGYENRTFTLNGGCQVFQSTLSCAEARASGEDELWQRFASDILASDAWGQQLHLKFVAFIGCTRYDGASVAASADYSYANIRKHLQAHAALGGGGLALFGSAHFYAWPQRFAQIGDCIRNTTRVDVARLPDESNYRRTYGGVYASTLGAVCHELGHCFDLGHTLDGVMGQGFDFLNRVLTVDQPTEHLPQRIVDIASATATATVTATATSSSSAVARPRFTKLKLHKQAASNQLLDNYHAQRLHDSFYFTHNCAVILAQHRWLRPNLSEEKLLPAVIELLPDSTEIVSNVPLRLVELRCNLNSLVAHYEELKRETLRYQLPAALWHLLAVERSHYAFVLTTQGDTKRLACDSS